MFKKATKKQLKLRLLLEGPSGSGKTYSSLILASGLGKKIAVIDTEKRSASLYADKADFDVVELQPPYTPESYIEAIQAAEANGYEVLIIDSITHEWSGTGGCLDIQSALGGRYQDWAKVTPRHNKFIETILQADLHIIATARTKSDYVIDVSGSKMKVSKVGMKTEQRDGLEFEFTCVLRLNENHMFTASKDRTGMFDNKEGVLTTQHAQMLLDWMDSGIDEVSEWKKQIEACESLEALKKLWMDIPHYAKKSLEETKDKTKNTIQGEI